MATHSHHASEAMTEAVRTFNTQLENLAELTVVLLVGALLPSAVPMGALWWFIPAMLLLVRPVAVASGALGTATMGRAGAMVAWFGIRGIGSVFYLMYAISHGVNEPLAQRLITLTLAVVCASIVVHGVSIRPLMKWYGRRQASPGR